MIPCSAATSCLRPSQVRSAPTRAAMASVGGLGTRSYRTFVARLADLLSANPPATVEEVALRWVDLFWAEYHLPPIGQLIQRAKQLQAKSPFAPGNAPAQGSRTEQEENEFAVLSQNLVVGFCIGGHLPATRQSEAWVTVFNPLTDKPSPVQLVFGQVGAWGAPNMMQRLFLGYDEELRRELLSCGKWGGTEAELNAILMKYSLNHPILPMRDAVDYVYSCVHSTVKAFKFSNLSQICGGPIEVATITADRRFRWVRHKMLDSAIADGEP